MRSQDRDNEKASSTPSAKKSVRIRESQDIYIRTTGLDEDIVTRAKAITEFSNLKLPVYSHQSSVSARKLQRMRIRTYIFNMFYMLIFMLVFMIKAYVFVKREYNDYTSWEWIGICNVMLMIPNIVYLCKFSNTSRVSANSIVPFISVVYNLALGLTGVYTNQVESTIIYSDKHVLFLKISIYTQIGCSFLTSILMAWIGCKIKLLKIQGDNTASYYESQLD